MYVRTLEMRAQTLQSSLLTSITSRLHAVLDNINPNGSANTSDNASNPHTVNMKCFEHLLRALIVLRRGDVMEQAISDKFVIPLLKYVFFLQYSIIGYLLNWLIMISMQ
jgi:hypothetical protein